MPLYSIIRTLLKARKSPCISRTFSIKTSFSLEYRDGFERLLGLQRRSAISSKASLTICRRKVANSTVLAAAAMAVLVWASWSDLTKREIPNAAAVLLGLTAVVDAWIGGSPLQAGWLGCISILIVGFPVSAYLGLIGAGDIKLLAAAALWTSARTLDLLLITAWAGGVLALLYLCLNLVRTRRTTEIPYGVAVSLSLLLMLTHMV